MKPFLFKSIGKASIIVFMMFIIMILLSFSLKEDKLIVFSKIVDSKNEEFPNFFNINFISELLSISLLIFSLLLYYIVVSTHKIELLKFYIMRLLSSFKKSDMIWNIISLGIFYINEICFSTYSFYFYLFISQFIIWCIIFFLKYSYFSKEFRQIRLYNFLEIIEYFKKNHEVLIFTCSLILAVLLVIFTKKFHIFQIPFIHFYVNLYLMILISVLLQISKLIALEYSSSRLHKQVLINNFIYSLIINSLNMRDSKKFEELIEKRNKTKLYELNNRKGFRIFLQDLNLKDIKLKKVLILNYRKLIIDYMEISSQVGKVIKERNCTNYIVAILLLLTTSIMLSIQVLIKTSSSNIILTLKSFFVIILFRLIVRSIEIGNAFYRDILPTLKIKNSNLTSGDRIKLVIYSLIEITILSSLLYSFAKIISQYKATEFSLSLYKLGLILIENIQYSFSVAFFNASFPLNILEDMYKAVSMDYWSLPIAIRFIHLIQLTISVILISLSITSYGSKTHNLVLYNLEFLDKKYYINEVDLKNQNKRVLFSSFNMKGLKNEVEDAWRKEKIDGNRYMELKELIDIYAFKKIN